MLVLAGLMAVFLKEVRDWETLAARLAREGQEATLDGILHSAITRATAEAVSYTATGNQDYAREATDALLFAQSAMGQLRRLGAERSDSEQWDKIARLRREQEELLSEVRRSVTKALRERSTQGASISERLEQLYAPEADADRIWLALVTWHDIERRALHHALRSQRQHVLFVAVVALLASMLGAFLVRALVVHDLVNPLRELTRVAQRLADGEQDVAVAVTAAGDMGRLQEAFVRLAQRLRDSAPQAARPASDEVAEELPSAEGKPAAAAAPAQAEAASEESAMPRRALLIAADPAERDLTRAMLQHCGMEVTVADSVRDGNARLDEGDFAIIVIDFDTPDAPDIAMTARKRGEGSGERRIPMIAIGPEAGAETPAWLIPGFDQYLKRPCSFFDLHAALSRHMPIG